MQKRILSIDGGGIRGIIPALILADLEEKSGKPVSEIFDMIVGTSTGGILALALSRRGQGNQPLFTARELVDIYQKHGKRVFSHSLWRKFKTVGGLRKATYSAKGVEEVLGEYLGGERLSNSLCDVVITSYDLERRSPHFFKSTKAKVESNRDYWLKDIARATSAAPTFFPPACVENIEGSYKACLVDGGVYANNPGSCALAEAKVVYGNDSDIKVLSLGTGELIKPIMHSKAKRWGKFGWVRPLLDVMFDGVADTVDYQLKQSLDYSHYKRLQITLDDGKDSMDDTTEVNIRALEYKAEHILRQNQDWIDWLYDN